MNISKLLNPLQEPLKRSRYDSDIDSVLINPISWLPVEIIGHIILFVDRPFRIELRLVSRAWYTAYMRYHRCSFLLYGRIMKSTRFTLEGALDALRNNGRNLRELFVTTAFFKELLEVEPNLGDLIPNVAWLSASATGDATCSSWLGKVVSKMSKLQVMVLRERIPGLRDEHFLEELDKALVDKRHFSVLSFEGAHITNMDDFPGPNLRKIAPQISTLDIPMSTINAENVSSKLALFCNVRQLGLSNVPSIEVLLAVANLLCEPKNMPRLKKLTLIAEFDITRAHPIRNPETGRNIRAYTLIDRICGIRRSNYRLLIMIGFTLGACSSGNPELVEIERKFLIELGKKHADALYGLHMTHFLPTSEYDPLSTLLYESAPRFPMLSILDLHLPPTAQNKQRLIDAVNCYLTVCRDTPFAFVLLGDTLFKPGDTLFEPGDTLAALLDMVAKLGDPVAAPCNMLTAAWSSVAPFGTPTASCAAALDMLAAPGDSFGPFAAACNMNNPFLLPRLSIVEWSVGDDADEEFVEGYDPIDPSRGVFFDVMEVKLFDHIQQAVEMGETIPSIFEPEEIGQ